MSAPGSLRHEAVGEIRRRIYTGELSAGTSYSEGELSEKIGISRAPVREALIVLTQLGWVTPQPRAGYSVSPMTLAELRDLYAVRQLLEPTAAALAAAGRSTATEDLEALRTFVDEECQSHVGDCATAHYRFHRRICVMSGNRELDRALGEVLLKLQRYWLLDPVWAELDRNHIDHGPLVDAIVNRDQESMKAAMTDHVEHSRTLVTMAIVDSHLITGAVLSPSAVSEEGTGATSPHQRRVS
ncbi:GntR family transcriptional regulator [Streptomyces mirabilis]|uniref:GntR family transcriptional regulator n=1 Tax=Streptomyces mirabilis TaxID=68239 RepID=UPI003324735A